QRIYRELTSRAAERRETAVARPAEVRAPAPLRLPAVLTSALRVIEVPLVKLRQRSAENPLVWSVLLLPLPAGLVIGLLRSLSQPHRCSLRLNG
ncbi:MAG: hypothetical protein RMI94_14525, partial [Bryobacterales bacterium]|nr:hypothetical protein [Bryobacteraceae bacterium]MDW8131763.1 hypothetical protein [Bryobacterales bacterium]